MRKSWLTVGTYGETLSAVVLACAAAAQVAAAEVSIADSPADQAQPKMVLSQWHSLYLAGLKIGYQTQNLYELPDGGRRLTTSQFLRMSPSAERFGSFKTTTADVDTRWRPRALDCRFVCGERQWQTTGQVENGELVLTRKVGQETATTRVPLDDDLTWQCWALAATVLSKTPAGQTRRWMVVDESTGALLPDACLVRVVGPRASTPGPDGRTVQGLAVVTACGPRQAVHLIDDSGRTLRSIWQSAPLVAEATSLTEARRLAGAAAAPPAAEIDGLQAERYRNSRLGLAMWIPPYPYIAHVAADSGAVLVADLTDEAYVLVRPTAGPPPPGATPPAQGGAEAARQASLVQSEWAARFDQVKVTAARGWAEAGPAVPDTINNAAEEASAQPAGGTAMADILPTVTPIESVLPAPAAGPAATTEPPAAAPASPATAATPAGPRTIEGTARLGCTTYHFRNVFLTGEGLSWLVSTLVADRPVSTKPMLAEMVAGSVRAGPPEGRLPVQVTGDTVRSPYYGFEVSRPSGRWRIPAHVDGPVSVLDLARDDGAAAVILKVLAVRPGQSLESLADDQAQRVADNMGLTKPVPRRAVLGGADATEFTYEGPKVVSGGPGRCTAVFAPLGSRVIAMYLVMRTDADPSAAKDLEAIRASLRLPAASAAPK